MKNRCHFEMINGRRLERLMKGESCISWPLAIDDWTCQVYKKVEGCFIS